MIKGFATDEGTRRYRARFPHAAPGHFREWDGLVISSVGLGTYLGDDDDATDRSYQQAIRRALEGGFNVVDSAINYRHQRSERSVGAALEALIASETIGRDEVLIASKGGFVPYDGKAPDRPAEYVVDAYVRPGIAAAGDFVGGVHCLAPRYLADQLDRSRANLGVETIDVYFVHNPETQLAAVDRPEFLGRMRAVFAFLEGAAAEGKIRLYGTATWNGYRQSLGTADALSLAELETIARELAGGAHHFRVIQLPYNLAMTEAFTQPTQALDGEAMSVLEAARRLGMYTMTSASIYQGQLARNLPPIISDFLPGLDTDAQRALQFVRSTPGMGTALVGMKTPAHVDDNAGVAAHAPIPWERFKNLFASA